MAFGLCVHAWYYTVTFRIGIRFWLGLLGVLVGRVRSHAISLTSIFDDTRRLVRVGYFPSSIFLGSWFAVRVTDDGCGVPVACEGRDRGGGEFI